MAYNPELVDSLRAIMDNLHPYHEKKMFGGIAFMVNGNMSLGVNKEDYMVRVGPDQYQELLAQPDAREMDFTKKPLKGFVFVEGNIEKKRLKWWCQKSLDFVLTLPAK